MAHNLCYSTLIPFEIARKMNPEDYTITPHGDYFVKNSKTKCNNSNTKRIASVNFRGTFECKKIS
jgi:hypothetical protein